MYIYHVHRLRNSNNTWQASARGDRRNDHKRPQTTTNQTAAWNSSCTNFGLFSPEHLSNGRLAHDARPVRVVHVEHGLQLVLTGP